MTTKERVLALFLAFVTLVGLIGPLSTADTYAATDWKDYEDEFVTGLLKRLGAGYVTGGGHYKHDGAYDAGEYDCTGLVTATLYDIGVTKPPISNWKDWGATIDWWYYLKDKSVGDTVVITDGDGKNVTYTITAKNVVMKGNEELFAKPGTIIFKIPEGEKSGHVAVSLGYFAWQGSPEKTEEYVRQSLIARYGNLVDAALPAFNAKYNRFSLANTKTEHRKGSTLATLLENQGETGTNNVYGHDAVWEYRDHPDYTDEQYYNPIWQIDSLATGYGVTVNNNPYGKIGEPMIFAVLEAPHEEFGDVKVKKIDSYGNALSGVTFEICEKLNGEYYVVDTATTGSDGVATFDGSEIGLRADQEYHVREIAGKIGYVTDLQTYQKVTIKKDDTVWVGTNAVVENKNWTGSITLTKTDLGTGAVLDGAEFVAYPWSRAAGAYASTGTTLTDEGNGVYRVSGLPYTEDNQGRYRVVETKAPVGHSGGWSGEYTITKDGEAFTETVTNAAYSLVLEVTKTNLANAKLPGAVFACYEWNGSAYRSTGTTLTDEGNGLYTLSGLTWTETNQGKFKVAEVSAPPGYTNSGWAEEFVLDETTHNTKVTYTVKNSPELTSITVVKVWDDANDADGVRPSSLVVELQRNGNRYARVTLNEANGWTYTWSGLASHDGTSMITWNVIEQPTIAGYTAGTVVFTPTEGAANSSIGTYVFTNSHTPEVTTVSGQKTWSVQDVSILPDSITVQLLADGKVVQTKTVTAADGWKYEFTNLPKNQSGTAIVYTVDEITPAGFIKTVTGYDIENKSTKVEISKTSLVDGKELSGATLQILDKNGKVVKEWTTNGTKTMIEAELIAGETYTLKETAAPAGYVIASEVNFTVKRDGSITKVSMQDDYTKVVINKVVK